MADPQNDAYIGVGYTFDQQSADRTVKGIDQVTKKIEYFGDVADSAAKTARSAVEFIESGGSFAVIEPFKALPPVIGKAGDSFTAFEEIERQNITTAKQLTDALERLAQSGGTTAASYREVQPATERTAQSMEALETQQRQNVQTTERLTKSNDGIIDGLYRYARANETAEETLARLRREQERAGRSLGRSEADIERAIRQQSRDQGGRDRSKLSSTTLIAVSQGLHAAGFRDAANVVNLVEDLGQAAALTSPPLLALIAVLTAITLLAREASRVYEEQAKRQQQIIDGLKTYFDLLQTGTADAVRAQRAALEDSLRAQQAQLAALEQQLTGTFQVLQSNLTISGDSPVAGVLSGDVGRIQTVIAEIRASIETLTSQLGAYNNALASATVQQRSYVEQMIQADQLTADQRAEAIDRMRREAELLGQMLYDISDPTVISEVLDRVEELNRQIEFLGGIAHTSADTAADLADQEAELERIRARQMEAFRRYIALELQLQDMDAAARKERVEAIQREIDLARLYLSESVGLDTEVIAEVEAGITALEQEMRRLQAASDTAADALNRTTRAQNVSPTIGGRGDALTAYYDRLEEFGDRVTDAADALLDANESLTDAQGKLAEAQRDLADLDTQLRADQLAAVTDMNTRLEDVQRDHEAARTEITRKGEAERARILRQSNALISNAYAQRDALAAYLAIQNRNQQLADQKDQETEALAQADAAAEEQRAAAAVHYRNALNDLQRRYDQEKVIRDRAVQQARADVTNAEYNLKYIRDQYNNLRIASEYNTQNQVMSAVQQGGAAIVQTWGLIAAQSVQAINAAFSQNMANQRQALAAGAVAATAARGNTVTINVAGAQTRTIDARSREQAYRVMDSIFERMGIRT